MGSRTLAGTAVGWLCLSVWVSVQAASSTYQQWDFGSAGNPASPTVASNTAGTATAAISTGFLGAGWVNNWPGYGTEQGYWDLGGQDSSNKTNDTRGRITLNVPVPAAVSGDSYTDVSLRVLQYVDGMIYTGDLTVVPLGLIFVGRTEVSSGGVLGKWVEDEFRGRVSPSPETISMTVTGSAFGTVVSGVRVDTVGPVSLPGSVVITSLRRLGENVSFTWSGGVPPYQVDATTNLLDGTTWQTVLPSTMENSAQIQMVDPVGFIRVRGSE